MAGNTQVPGHLLRDDHLPISTEPTPEKPNSFITNELANDDEERLWVIKLGLWENSKDSGFRNYLGSFIEEWKSKSGDAVDLWAMGLVEYEKLKDKRLFTSQEVNNAHSFLGLIYEHISQTEAPELVKEIEIEWTFLYAEDVQIEERKKGITSNTPRLIAQTIMTKYPEFQTGYDQAA